MIERFTNIEGHYPGSSVKFCRLNPTPCDLLSSGNTSCPPCRPAGSIVQCFPNDRGQLSAHAVADHLAKLNYKVHLGIRDKSVGPRCIVAWRYRKEGRVQNGGGGHQCYTGTTRDGSSPPVPVILGGIDFQALASVMIPLFTKRVEAMRAGEPPLEWNEDEINAELARIPDEPDENLR